MSSLSPKPELVKYFFDTLYPEDPRFDTSIVLWRLSDRRSISLPTAAAATAAAIINPVNMFVGVGLRQGVLPPYRRGRFDEIAGIPGLFADIDIKSDAHPDEKLPESALVCMEILGRLPLRPTMTLSTGGGIHAYWLFNEFWYFDSPEDRLLAKNYLTGWKNTICAEFAAAGLHVDGSTFELTRVLRPAGTVRHKPDIPPNLVQMIHMGKRLNAADFKKYQHASDALPEVIADLSMPEQINGRIVAMLDNCGDYHDALFATWNRKPQRESQHRWSQSEWDMSLASYLAALDMPPQDIYDALVIYRARNSSARKRDHAYFARTVSIALARKRTPEIAPENIMVTEIPAPQVAPWTSDDLDIIDRALDLGRHGYTTIGMQRAGHESNSPVWLELLSQDGAVVALPLGTIDILSDWGHTDTTDHAAESTVSWLKAQALIALGVELTPVAACCPSAFSTICRLAVIQSEEYQTRAGVSIQEFRAVVTYYVDNYLATHPDHDPKSLKPHSKDGVSWVFIQDLRESLFPDLLDTTIRQAFKLAFPGFTRRQSRVGNAYSLTP